MEWYRAIKAHSSNFYFLAKMEKQGPDLSCELKQPENQAKYIKKQFSRHWALDNKEKWSQRDRKQIRWALYLSHFAAQGKLTDHNDRWGNPSKAQWSPWIEEMELVVWEGHGS